MTSKVTSSVRKLRTLLTAIKQETLVPNPPFQRRLVWTSADKRNFIATVLKGLPFPEIFIAAGAVDTATGIGTEMLVDGQQRLTTLYQYFVGSTDLKLSQDLTRYSLLPEQSKQDFLEYEVVVRDLGVMTKTDMVSIFELINSTSYPANAMEIQHARYAGGFYQLGAEVSQDQFFESHKVFSANEVRRMQDVSFVLTFVTTIMSSYFNRDDELAEYLEKYNDEFETAEDIRREVNQVLAFVSACTFEGTSRIRKKGDLLTLLVEMHRILIRHNIRLDVSKVSKALKEFYYKVDNFNPEEMDTEQPFPKDFEDISRYARAAAQATNDRGPRIIRGNIIAKMLETCATTGALNEYPPL